MYWTGFSWQQSVQYCYSILSARKLNPRNPDRGLFGTGVCRQAAPASTPVPHLGTAWPEASNFHFLLCKAVTRPLPVTWGDGMSF